MLLWIDDKNNKTENQSITHFNK